MDGSGTIRIGGSADYTFEVFIATEFSIGDTVFTRHDALKGRLRRHTIKDILVDELYGPIVYLDTFNAQFNENELMVHADADALVQQVLIDNATEIENAVLNS